MSRVDLAPQTAAWLRQLAAQRGLSEERLLADLVEAEVARAAAPRPDDLSAREAGGTGRELAAARGWRVVLVPHAEEELRRFPPALLACVEQAAAALAADPFQGKESGGRRRAGFRYAGGEWRLVYTVAPATRTITVLLATTRENAVY